LTCGCGRVCITCLHSFGAIHSILAKYTKAYRSSGERAGSFDQDAVYLLGEPLVVSETGRVTAAFSSTNLLLNAVRQSRFGLPPFVAVDTTHRPGFKLRNLLLVAIMRFHCSQPWL
jgi:hypothetical protein